MPLQLLASMPTRGKITLAASALVFVVTAIFLMRLASAPAYTTVMAGMDPTDAGKVTAALDGAGVGYEIRSGGTEVAVVKGMESKARVALADQGVSGTARQPGFELLDKQKLGASNFQQQVAYQRALEGQIAQTVSSIDGVSGAQVRLTLPKDELFTDEQKPATAAVLLDGGSGGMDPGQIRGIANLVASSVPDLKADSVTITDGAGQMVWPVGDGTGAGGGELAGGLAKPAAEARYAAQLESSLDALLVRTLGPDKAHVQVAADLDVSRATQEKLQYAKKGVPLKETVESETLRGTGAGSGGAAGTTANIPGAATGAVAGGTSDYRHRTTQRDLGVDKTVTRTQIAPGTVQRLDVAVVIDKKVPAADVAQLKTALTSAAGIRADRGDTLAVSQVAFAAVPEPEAVPAGPLPIPSGMAGPLKGVAIGLGALLFLFFVTRHLRKRETVPFADEPSWLKALPAGGSGELSPPATTVDQVDFSVTDEAMSVFKADPRAVALEELVVREPERVASQLRAWITEDK
ncbi:flagellar basal-body MS-ring/collar protein FliF [Paraconexibacter sp.]|uniref:flagellar basal-body MS-ring/collar protein FliF n=1 Tax=Paraconexibacter sp. TaxID=2949640 RepID=UPI0035637860